MLKIRLQGTKRDIEWFEKLLHQSKDVQVTESSESFANKGTNRFYRKYIEIKKNGEKNHV